MTYRHRASFVVAAEHRTLVFDNCQRVSAYLQQRHPDVSVRYFADEIGDRLRLHLYTEAEDLDALARARGTAATDPRFLELGAAVASLVLEAESEPYPSVEI